MRVLVTGGAGYIGSGVVEQLLASGHSAVVYDSLYKGHRDAVHPQAEFIQADLLNAAALGSALDGVEAVVHMAADSLVGESVSEPAKYYRNNVVAGLALLEAMRERSIRWLVFSSTAAVYGEPARQPIEESAPAAPTNPYGETKLAFERALHWPDECFLRCENSSSSARTSRRSSSRSRSWINSSAVTNASAASPASPGSCSADGAVTKPTASKPTRSCSRKSPIWCGD